MTRLPNIQILRACAALMIVVNHCGIETGRIADSLGRSRLFDEFFWGHGVPLFFAVSGFIMVATGASAFGMPGAALDFARRRAIRIVPLYWAVTTVSLAAALAVPSLMAKVPPGDYGYVAASYLFWPAMRLTGDIRPLATPGWTLNLEMLFYAIFAVALLFPRRKGLALIFGTLGLLVAARVGGLLPGVALNFWGDPIVLGFLFGVAAGLAYNKGVRLSGPGAVLLLIAGIVALWAPGQLAGPEDAMTARLAAAVPSTIVLLAVALGPQVDGRWRLWAPALLIGDASYSLYLVHEFLLRLLYLVWLKTSLIPAALLWLFVPAGIAIAVSAALVAYWCFERPVTRWLRHVPAFGTTDGSRGPRERRLATPTPA